MKHLFFLITTLALLALACGGAEVPAGQVYVAQTQSTVYWVNQAFNGANFTQILTNGQGGYFVIWNPTGATGVGFTLIKDSAAGPQTAVIDWMKATGGKGNLVNFRDMKGIVDYMKQHGWKPIAATQVPQALKASWATTWEIMSAGYVAISTSLVSLIVIPVTATAEGLPEILPDWSPFSDWYLLPENPTIQG